MHQKDAPCKYKNLFLHLYAFYSIKSSGKIHYTKMWNVRTYPHLRIINFGERTLNSTVGKIHGSYVCGSYFSRQFLFGRFVIFSCASKRQIMSFVVNYTT